jgi:hypothetical protein
MARKSKRKRRVRKTAKRGWWASLNERSRRRVVLGTVIPLVGLAVAYGGWLLTTRVEARVEEMLLARVTPSLEFVDLPAELADLAEGDLRASVADLLQRDWTDDQLCRDMASRFATVGWVQQVHHVRRTSEGRFELSCRYRSPFAMVQQGNEFLLVDAAGVRLPGTYQYDSTWQLIQGVAQPAPSSGSRWEGQDLQAGLAVIAALAWEPFADQITAVLVDNHDGRSDPKAGHLELATDRAGGRIRWGSAPGEELEENGVERKLAILRENFRRTGRADARHPVIDISTFPDRFTIPG